MFESYELMLKQAVEAMDEEALLDLMACFYKAFSNKVDADACAWSVGRNVVYRNSFKVWLVPLSETCENAFRSIGLEWCSVDVDEPGESFTDDLQEYYRLVPQEWAKIGLYAIVGLILIYIILVGLGVAK